MSKKKSKYVPQKKYNPVQQLMRLEKLKNRIDQFKNTIDALSQSNDNHISYLANFARHDIKNSIQSMDSVLSTNNSSEITNEHILSLKTNLKVIRETIDNFSKLVPYSEDEKFNFNVLINALELLNRATLHKRKIQFIKEIPYEIDIKFSLPFQAMLQMLNNLMINSIKSTENIELPELPIIKLEAIITDKLEINLYDNGIKIEEKQKHKIFEYGYSTTGGSGIGLFHAKYLCDLFDGSINLIIIENDIFTKKFNLHLPINPK